MIVLDLDGRHKVLAFEANTKSEAQRHARVAGYELRGGVPVDIGASAHGHARAWHLYVTKIHVHAAPPPRSTIKPATEAAVVREGAAVATAPKQPKKARKPKKPKAAKRPKARKGFDRVAANGRPGKARR